MKYERSAEVLTSHSVEVLGQLFTTGPVWDGNIISKAGRDQLIRMRFADRVDGWAFLTREGVQLAVEWKNTKLFDERWHEKLRRA